MSECEFDSMLSPYYDGELDDIEQRRVERHLDDCDLCAAELERLGTLSAVFSAIPTPIASAPFLQQLEKQADKVQQAALARFVRGLTAIAAAAAALALAVGRYTAADRPQAAPRPAATLSSWERAAIDPVPTSNATATASAESQFDDFLVHDLGGIQ
jgi:anti-sigma factor RsiW